MEGLIIGVILFVAVILILLVLAQNSKGGGLTGTMGGATQVMGSRRTTDWIEKATWGFAIALFVFSMAATALIEKDVSAAGTYKSVNVENAVAPIAPAVDETTTSDAKADDIATSGDEK